MLGNKLKKLIILSMMTTMIWSTQALVTEASSYEQFKTRNIYINDQKITISVIDQNGYQLVPAALFKQIGAMVNWNAKEGSALFQLADNQIKLPIGKRTAYYSDSSEQQWVMDTGLETRTTLINGQSYVPLAYTARKLGLQVEYNQALKSAIVSGDVSLQQQANGQAVGSLGAESLSNSGTTILDQENLYWLQKITEAESGGEAYEGRVAVAAVVLNRVASKDWPNTVKEVVFDVAYINGKRYYQFEPVLNEYIYQVTPSETTKQAVQDALNGVDPTSGAVVFYNPEKTSNKWILSRPVVKTIGDHVFAK